MRPPKMRQEEDGAIVIETFAGRAEAFRLAADLVDALERVEAYVDVDDAGEVRVECAVDVRHVVREVIRCRGRR